MAEKPEVIRRPHRMRYLRNQLNAVTEVTKKTMEIPLYNIYEYQLEKRLELINAFIDNNLREELYLASGVGEKDKPMWKVIETNMLFQEHMVDLEENRLLWKQWNRGNQTEGKACSKNPVPHVCICDQNITPKNKMKKKKGKGKELPAWYKRDKETNDEDRFCGCCCKSRDKTGTPIPIADVIHDDSSSNHSGSFVTSATNSNSNSFVNSKSTIVSKTGSIGSKTGSVGSKAGSAVSKPGSVGSKSGSAASKNKNVALKHNSKVGLNNNSTSSQNSLKKPSKISVKSAENGEKTHSESIVSEHENETKSCNLLLDVPEYHISTISLSGPHTTTTTDSVSGDATLEVTMVDAAINTIMSYPEPKTPKDDIFSRMKKKQVEEPPPKSTVRKSDALKPGNTLKIYKMANRDIQRKLTQQKAIREQAEKAVMGLDPQKESENLNDLGDTEKEESIYENTVVSETNTDDDVVSDVENACVPDQEKESNIKSDENGTDNKSSTCQIM